MDADVMITIAFCLEVVLFGLVATVAAAGGVRKANREAAAEDDRDRGKAAARAIEPNGGDASRLVIGCARRALGGLDRRV